MYVKCFLDPHNYELFHNPSGHPSAVSSRRGRWQEEGMARRSKAEALETRETILDAAIEVFHQHGVARPSLTEVARLAGVTRGAVYGHFRNKADLFNALCDRIRLPAET